jgi:hypothetical protein
LRPSISPGGLIRLNNDAAITEKMSTGTTKAINQNPKNQNLINRWQPLLIWAMTAPRMPTHPDNAPKIKPMIANKLLDNSPY